MADVRAARRLLGPYELGERLGAGGMAEVFIAQRAGPHGFAKRFAIKRILPQLAKDPRFVAMFCDEARICAALNHPNIVQVVDFGEHGGDLFMAMEYVEGVSCAKLLRSVAARGERFPLGAALFIAHEVLRALAFAHEARDDQARPLGIVHRDVSPGNVLLGRAGEVKLTDFGIVRGAFIDRRTYPGELKGKLGYMAPEQAVGAEVDARSDIFAVGIVLSEMLLARPLFPGHTEMEILTRIYEADLTVIEDNADLLRPDLVAVLKTALSRDPERRYQTAREFADALRTVARAASIQLSDAELTAWLSSSGLLPSASGSRHVAVRPSDPGDIVAAARAAAARARAAMPTPTPRSLLIAVGGDPGGARYGLGIATGEALSLPEVLERIATGRASARTLVSRDGDESVALDELPELSRLSRRSAFCFGSPASDQDIPLERATLPAVLISLGKQRATGLFVARDANREKRVYLRDGAPVFVASTSRSELLGARLVEAKLVTQSAVERTLVLASEAGGVHLGEMLVRRGLLRPTELLRALVDQLESRFVELGSWRSGQIAFFPDERSTDELPPSPRSPYELISAAVRKGYGEEELADLLEPWWDEPIARNPVCGLGASELGLTPAEQAVLNVAVAAAGVGAVLRGVLGRGLARREEALRAVYIGLSSGCLVSPGWPSRGAAQRS